MVKTLSMFFIQYINLFEKLFGLRAEHCFSYNNSIIFVVKPFFIARVMSRHGLKVKKLSFMIRKKTKIVSEPKGMQDINRFVSSIVYPVRFKKITITGEEDNKEAIINAGGMQSKATLIGRNKTKQKELQNILQEYFGIRNLRIS